MRERSVDREQCRNSASVVRRPLVPWGLEDALSGRSNRRRRRRRPPPPQRSHVSRPNENWLSNERDQRNSVRTKGATEKDERADGYAAKSWMGERILSTVSRARRGCRAARPSGQATAHRLRGRANIGRLRSRRGLVRRRRTACEVPAGRAGYRLGWDIRDRCRRRAQRRTSAPMAQVSGFRRREPSRSRSGQLDGRRGRREGDVLVAGSALSKGEGGAGAERREGERERESERERRESRPGRDRNRLCRSGRR